MQSQAPRKPPRPDKSPAAAQDDETAAWFQYPVAAPEDPLERDLFSELFGEAQVADAAGGGRACKEETECAGDAAPQSGLMPPPPPREKACCQGDLGDASDGAGECAAAAEVGESSMLTIGSSFCGSNHVQTPRAGAPPPPGGEGGGRAGGGKDRDAATVTSSAMRPRSCTTKAGHGHPGAAAHRSGKRKPASDAAETEEAEFESADATCEAPAQKMTTAKRRRAAEVHNLSERRRRDRINENMKALQELNPHCNKTDKASMLDEAIEYLKSLQLQLQMMWMGGGGGAGDVPGGGPPVHAAGGGGPSPRGVHAQDAVHGGAGRAEPAGGRPLRALPRRRPPPAGGATAHGSAALPAGDGRRRPQRPCQPPACRRRLHERCLQTASCTKNTKIVASLRSRV